MKFFQMCVFLIFFNLILTAAEEPHKLVVSGNASLHFPADKFMLKIGVVTLDENAESAIKANAKEMQQIIDALKNTGLDETEFQTGTFSVIPHYTPPPQNPLQGWQATINGYEVRNSLSIRTSKLDLAGRLIDAAAKGGANLFEDIIFSLHDTQNAQAEAIAKAVRQGRVYAEAAAKEAGVKLGDILDLAINQSNLVPRFMRAEKFSMATMDTATPIAPGEVEVTASVSITYEIKR